MSLPHIEMRPTVSRDGNAWCALYGANIAEGVCGFGASPEEACAAFDRAWWGVEEMQADEPEPPAPDGGKIPLWRFPGPEAVRELITGCLTKRYPRDVALSAAIIVGDVTRVTSSVAAVEVGLVPRGSGTVVQGTVLLVREPMPSHWSAVHVVWGGPDHYTHNERMAYIGPQFDVAPPDCCNHTHPVAPAFSSVDDFRAAVGLPPLGA